MAYRKRTSLVDAMILVTMTVNQKHLKKDNRRNLLLPSQVGNGYLLGNVEAMQDSDYEF